MYRRMHVEYSRVQAWWSLTFELIINLAKHCIRLSKYAQIPGGFKSMYTTKLKHAKSAHKQNYYDKVERVRIDNKYIQKKKEK